LEFSLLHGERKLEADLKLEITKKLDASQTSQVGETFTPARHRPDDALELYNTIYAWHDSTTSYPSSQELLDALKHALFRRLL
jgi:hypothetical protein